MTPRHLAAAAALFLVACAGEGKPAPDASTTTGTRTPKVLVIGIDGIRPDVLAEVPTPNLDALAADGTFTDRARTGYPSMSGPGWSSLLIGVWPEKHGVTNNDFTGKRYDIHHDFLTRVEEARPELGTFAVTDWTPLSRAADGMATISDRVDVKPHVDGDELGWTEADERSVELAEEHLRTADPAAMFVYLGAADEISHEHHSIGQEYRDAIARADGQVGRLVAAMKARATWDREDWLVLVSTDHGRRDDGGHGGDTDEERTIFYIASGPSAVRGTPSDSVRIVDLPVTALTHLGIPIDPAWQLDGRVVGLER